MQEKEWLIERVDPAEVTVPDATIPPMLCTPERTPISNIKFKYEVKWDGIRALIYISKESTRILSRSGREIQGSFNELTEDAQNLSCTEAIVDGEIVALDEAGKPDFKSVVSRLNSSKSIKGRQNSSSIYFYTFDLLFVDGVKTIRLPLERRRALLQQLIKPGGLFRFSESVDDGEALFKATA